MQVNTNVTGTIAGSRNGHRSVTLPASQYLSTAGKSDSFGTGSVSLDDFLGGDGLSKGRMLEISGPPGSGKTANAACRFCGQERPKIVLDRYVYKATNGKAVRPLSRPREELIVVDDISSVILREFSSAQNENRNISKTPNGYQGGRGEKLAEKKQRIVGELTSTISKLAGHLNTTIVIITQLASQVPSGGGRLVLFPSTSDMHRVWSSAFHHRFLLVRNGNQCEGTTPESTRTMFCLDHGTNFLLGETLKPNTLVKIALEIGKDGVQDDVGVGHQDPEISEKADISRDRSEVSIRGDSGENVVSVQNLSEFHSKTVQLQATEGIATNKRRKLDEDAPAPRNGVDTVQGLANDPENNTFNGTDEKVLAEKVHLYTLAESAKVKETIIPDSDDDEDETDGYCDENA